MVRIVSASSIGLGDYGGSIMDREVDGLWYDFDKPVPQPVTAAPIKAVAIASGKPLTVNKGVKILSQPAKH